MLAATSPSDLDSFGGCKCLTAVSRGFFYVTRINGRWFLIDPDGFAFIIRGVNYVRFNADVSINGDVPYTENALRKYGSREAWVKATASRLREWGFNTLGAWSDIDLGIPYTVILSVTPSYYRLKGGSLARRTLVLARNPEVLWQPFGTFPDVYDPDFVKAAESAASQLSKPKDPMLVGYFTDNEVDFNPEVIFAEYADMTPGEPGKVEFIRALASYFNNDVKEFNSRTGMRIKGFDDLMDYKYRELQVIEAKAPVKDSLRGFKTTFAKQVASRYSEVTVNAIRKFDPNHLVLGDRRPGANGKEAVEGF
ncbi:hypothetical protein [Caldivirga maquilingensis]|uniref:hypothetical protein n=1 Tax=Caldivirga maquilingensis TaxID=76887 RepID=UPI0000F248EC|nr:hypothetical protein [Caldivirga maquilingensis]